MSKTQLYRSVIAASVVTALWYFVALSQAIELHPMVVVGIPADSIATEYPTPKYPRLALDLHISGEVLVTVHVENGKVVETSAASHSSILAESATRWVDFQWKFKPYVSGVFTIPISYRESA
jgi:hypothetical protein